MHSSNPLTADLSSALSLKVHIHCVVLLSYDYTIPSLLKPYQLYEGCGLQKKT